MIIRKKLPRALGLNEPLRHPDHKRPVTRRDFIGQGFLTGTASVVMPSLFAALMNPNSAQALTQVQMDLDPTNLCKITLGAGKIPFICFDLSGGANLAGSNVLVGQAGGQLDVLSTAGYSKLGLPGTMLPNSSGTTTFIDTSYGLAFHSDSAILRGMKMTATTAGAKTQGAVIPAVSQNDTGNNPHNPMYGIAKAGANGQLLTLIGSQNTDSGGNSMSPASLMDPTIRPTKVDRPSDARGLVDTGDLGTMFGNSPVDTVHVMESMERISKLKLNATNTKLATAGDDTALKQQVDCAYVRSAYMAENFSSPDVLDPTKDTSIASIFSTVGGISADSEFGKTAAVMKLVVGGFAGAGTIQMGGFDYHTGDRATGEARDFRAGVCIGACLEFAARAGKPIMIYVFSDGSLNSNGMIDNSVGGRGKGVWTGDNQSTAASFFLVFDPAARPTPIVIPTLGGGVQLGRFRATGDVETTSSPGANSVTALVDMVLLNYMALHGEQGNFATAFPNSVLNSQISAWTAFGQLPSVVNGRIT
jgi:hypothetical protein